MGGIGTREQSARNGIENEQQGQSLMTHTPNGNSRTTHIKSRSGNHNHLMTPQAQKLSKIAGTFNVKSMNDFGKGLKVSTKRSGLQLNTNTSSNPRQQVDANLRASDQGLSLMGDATGKQPVSPYSATATMKKSKLASSALVQKNQQYSSEKEQYTNKNSVILKNNTVAQKRIVLGGSQTRLHTTGNNSVEQL